MVRWPWADFTTIFDIEAAAGSHMIMLTTGVAAAKGARFRVQPIKLTISEEARARQATDVQKKPCDDSEVALSSQVCDEKQSYKKYHIVSKHVFNNI